MQKRGFTLIELLVVIAIIGLLASVVLASMGTARAKGRDAKRISDIKELQLALQLYSDANNEYPTTPSGNKVSGLSSALASEGYISSVPDDPSGSPAAYGYIALPSGCTNSGSSICTNYIIGAKLETNNASLSDSYKGTGIAGNPAFMINGATHYCSQTASPNFIFCGTP